MKKFSIFVLVFLSLLFTQTIDWQTTIPFESSDDGAVGIDIDKDGNILVACYTNGPNTSEWLVDSLIASPRTKVVSLDPSGNIIGSEDFGFLFNDEVAGIGCTEAGYTLFGDNKNYYYESGDYYISNAWFVNYQIETTDTIKYSSEDNNGYILHTVKTNNAYQSGAILTNYQAPNGGKFRQHLLNNYGEFLLNSDSLSHPDSIYIEKSIFCIYDFDYHVNDGFFLTGIMLDFVYLGYNYVIKTDDSNNVIWGKYIPYTYNSDSPRFYSTASNSNGDCIVTIWNDQNGDNNENPSEYFLRKYSSDGDFFYDSSPFLNLIHDIFYIGNNQYIGLENNSNKIYKFTDTGSSIQIDWVEEIANDGVLRPIDNGFIVAGTEGTTISIKKYNATTGIENPNLIPTTSKLHQNYPNPFNPVTEISYSISNISDVKLSIYNTNGEIVATLVDLRQGNGNYTVEFNAEYLNSGIYFYKLSVDGNTIDTKKMVLVK